MRCLAAAILSLSLGGCAAWLPSPDPQQAWIDLRPAPETRLQALAVDRERVEDSRYFQVPPGRRALAVRYHFVVAPADVGTAPGLPRDCLLSLEYAGFEAGQRYRLAAGHHGVRPWAKLYDDGGRLLAQAREQGCGAPAIALE